MIIITTDYVNACDELKNEIYWENNYEILRKWRFNERKVKDSDINNKTRYEEMLFIGR